MAEHDIEETKSEDERAEEGKENTPSPLEEASPKTAPAAEVRGSGEEEVVNKSEGNSEKVGKPQHLLPIEIVELGDMVAESQHSLMSDTIV